MFQADQWTGLNVEWNGMVNVHNYSQHVQLVLSIKAELATMCLGLLSAEGEGRGITNPMFFPSSSGTDLGIYKGEAQLLLDALHPVI